MTGRVSSCAAMPGAIPHLLMFTKAVPAWFPPVPDARHGPRGRRFAEYAFWTVDTRGAKPFPRRTVLGSTGARFEVRLGDVRARDLGSEVTCSHGDGSSSTVTVLCMLPHDGERQEGLSEPQQYIQSLDAVGQAIEGVSTLRAQLLVISRAS